LTLIEIEQAARKAAQAKGFPGPNGWYEGYYDALKGATFNPYIAGSESAALYDDGQNEGFRALVGEGVVEFSSLPYRAVQWIAYESDLPIAEAAYDYLDALPGPAVDAPLIITAPPAGLVVRVVA